MSKSKSNKPTYSQLKALILETARELYQRGPGWAQEGVVLHEVFQKLGGQYRNSGNDELQQRVLTCWHDLFLSRKLSWGFNLDNPNWPFFHLPTRDDERDLEFSKVEAAEEA